MAGKLGSLSLSLFGSGSSSDLVLRVIEPESGQYLLVSTSDNDIIIIKVQFVFDEEFITLHDIFVSLLPLTTSTMLIKALKDSKSSRSLQIFPICSRGSRSKMRVIDWEG